MLNENSNKDKKDHKKPVSKPTPEFYINKIIDNIDCEIAIIDNQFTIQFVNKRRIDKHGNNIIAQKCYNIFPANGVNTKKPCTGCPAQELFAGKDLVSTNREHKIKDDLDHEYIIREHVSPIIEEQGNINSVIIVIEDVSHQSKYERKKQILEEAKQKLQVLKSYNDIVNIIVNTLKKCGYRRVRYYDVNKDSSSQMSYFVGRYSVGMHTNTFEGYRFKETESYFSVCQWKKHKVAFVSSHKKLPGNEQRKCIKDFELENEKWISVPVIIGDDLIGLIALDNKGGSETLNKDDSNLLKDFSRYASQVITISRIILNLKIINSINARIARLTDQNLVLKIITKEICTGLEATHCAIFLYSSRTETLERAQIYISGFAEEDYNRIPHESYDKKHAMSQLMINHEIVNVIDFNSCSENLKRKIDWITLKQLEANLSHKTDKKIAFKNAMFAPLTIHDEYIGLVRIINNRNDSNVPFPELDKQFIRSINNQIVIILKKAQLLNETIAAKNYAEELNKEMEMDLTMAREIQTSFLSNHISNFPHEKPIKQSAMQFYYRYLPAATLAGDFFHILPISTHKVGIVICDVMGHGVRASLLTTYLYGLIGELRPIADNPSAFLKRVSSGLLEVMAHSRVGIFATTFYLVVDIRTKTISYTNAGHPAPLVMNKKTHKMQLLQAKGHTAEPALGILKDFDYSIHQFQVTQGDRILLFTDGIYEVENHTGDIFGRENLYNLVAKYHTIAAPQLFDGLLKEINSFSRTNIFNDDVCLVAIDFSC